MSQILSSRVNLLTASIASHVASREGLRVPGGDGKDVNGDKKYLSLMNFDPVGYPLVDELLVIEKTMRNPANGAATDKEAKPELTTQDVRFDELTAHVHDRLLNCVIPLAAEAPPINELATINDTYGDTLRAAEFAKPSEAELKKGSDARNLLFTESPGGELVATEVLEKYRTYEADIEAQTTRLVEARNAGDLAMAALLEKKIGRIRAEWATLGFKHEVESAFALIQRVFENAGFQDERNRFIELFESGRRMRLSAAGQSYHTARLVPVAPLFESESGGSWRTVTLNKNELVDGLHERYRQLFDVDDATLQLGSQDLKTLSFELFSCDVVREWLEPEFLAARYWRKNGTLVSDGKGGGIMPTIPVRLLFVRRIEAQYNGFAIRIAGSGKTRRRTVLVDNRRNRTKPGKLSDSLGVKAQFQFTKALLDKRKKTGKRRSQTRQVQVVREKIRDHRKRKIRIANTPRPRNKRPAAVVRKKGVLKIVTASNRFLINGKIETRAELSKTLQKFKLVLRSQSADFSAESSIELKASSGGSVTFQHKFNAGNEMLAASHSLHLQDHNGDELIAVPVSLNKQNRRLNFHWHLVEDNESILVGDEALPILYGYALKPLARCPDPDQSLTWN